MGTIEINLFTLGANSLPVSLPVFRGTGIHCGFPSPAMDYLQESLNLNELLINRPSTTFFCEVTGDSMIGAFISDPAMLIIDRSLQAKNGCICLAVVNQEFIIRQYNKKGDVITLSAANKKYQDIVITEGMDFEIWGIVSKVIIDPAEVAIKSRRV